MSNYTDNLTQEVKQTLKTALDNRVIENNITLNVDQENSNVMDIGSMLKPRDDAPNELIKKLSAAAQQMLNQAESLYEVGQKYEQEFVIRGHEAVYAMLKEMYALSSQITESPDQQILLAYMRKHLREKFNIKLNSSSTVMGTLVRYVIRADKNSASRYGKVLEVAKEEDVTVENFISFVKNRGGISKITMTQNQQIIQSDLKRTASNRVNFAREICKLMSITSKDEIQFNFDLIHHRQDKKSAKQGSDFIYFMAAPLGGKKYRIIGGHNFDKTFEDLILTQIAKPLPANLGVIEKSIRNFIKHILNDTSLSQGTKDFLHKELNKPLLHSEPSESVVREVPVSTIVQIPHSS